METVIRYVGADYWDRLIFQDNLGKFYKTMDILTPDEGFCNLSPEEQEGILRDLHTCEPYDDPEGEPGWPVRLENFQLAE